VRDVTRLVLSWLDSSILSLSKDFVFLDDFLPVLEPDEIDIDWSRLEQLAQHLDAFSVAETSSSALLIARSDTES
jgi:hypothetical protein